MSHHARGTFDVKLNPQNSHEESIGRMTIDKQFQGDLEATSKGEFLGVQDTVKGSGGYVAIEKVIGKLNGRDGAFVLQHSGTMKRGESLMKVSVVPDSGTNQLMGLQGSMTIRVEKGKHSYEFDYTLIGEGQ
jgi:hypothetical protein